MGRRIPWEQAAGMRMKKDNDFIVMPPNKYGFQININHPNVLPIYEAYKCDLGERILSDKQRLEFERRIFVMLGNGTIRERKETHDET